MSQQTEKKMICTICGCERTIVISRVTANDGRSAVQHLLCIRCKAITEHKESSVYELEKQNILRKKKFLYASPQNLECNQILANRISDIQNVFIKCSFDNGLFVLFRNAGEAADWILMNELTKIATRETIIKNVKDVLKGKGLTAYGQRFRYVYLVLYGKYAESTIGYCRLKGCYLSEADLAEKECHTKKCWNFKVNNEQRSD